MIFLVALVGIAGVIRWRAGTPLDLSRLRFRHLWLVLVAFAVQTLLFEAPGVVPDPIQTPLHLATYVALGAFVVTNLGLAGMRVIAVGGASNALAIAANGGVMPASAAAWRFAGLPIDDEFTNSGTLAHPRLAFLGDVFALPRGLPFANVFSIGDVVLMVGFALLIAAAARPRTEADTGTGTAAGSEMAATAAGSWRVGRGAVWCSPGDLTPGPLVVGDLVLRPHPGAGIVVEVDPAGVGVIVVARGRADLARAGRPDQPAVLLAAGDGVGVAPGAVRGPTPLTAAELRADPLTAELIRAAEPGGEGPPEASAAARLAGVLRRR